MRAFIRLLYFILLVYEVQAIQLPQNPSPMRDDTREHVRIPETQVPGRRVALSPEQTLLVPREVGANTRLVIHFHGPSWIAEQAVHKRFPAAAVLSVQARGAGSDAYRELLMPAATERFPQMLEEAAKAAGVSGFRSVILTSFSAGYGAVREILRDPENRARVSGVVLADSMHASYGEEAGDTGPFVEFAREAAAGTKRFLITHSEVFPGTYASTTETASFLLRELGLKRRPVLHWGAIGMQQLSKASKGGLLVLGFAGNSAPDHMDHLFALDEWLARLPALPRGGGSARKSH